MNLCHYFLQKFQIQGIHNSNSLPVVCLPSLPSQYELNNIDLPIPTS